MARAEIEQVQQQYLKVLDDIRNKIKALPDNPNIQRMDDTNCYTMMKSQLTNKNWCPEYYDYTWQDEALAMYIVDDSIGMDQLLDRVEKVISEGKIPYPITGQYDEHPPVYRKMDVVKWSSNYKQILNPVVISYIQALFAT